MDRPRRPEGARVLEAEVDHEREAAVAALAAEQAGLVTRAQLQRIGLARNTVRRRVARGLLVPMGSGTFRLASVAPSDAQVVRAACLDRDGVASHRAGAWKHRLMELGGVIDISVAKGRSVSAVAADHRTLVVHTSTNLPDDDVVDIDGTPTTSLARTLFGLAALVPTAITDAQLLDLVSAAIETQGASMAWLRWLLAQRRCRGRNGVTAFERALDARSVIGPTESWLERSALALIETGGLPRPALQRRIARGPGRAARVDFLYADLRIVLEVLGYAFHRTAEQLTADTMRANELQLAGYIVLQVTSRTMAETPDALPALVARARAGRALVLTRQRATNGALTRQNGLPDLPDRF